jgi:hypothetical protein
MRGLGFVLGFTQIRLPSSLDVVPEGELRLTQLALDGDFGSGDLNGNARRHRDGIFADSRHVAALR